MKKRLFINSTSGVVQVVISTIFTFATIPLFLSLLGKEMYGIYSLITTISMVGYFINFGFNISIIKFISEQGIGNDSDRDIIVSFSLAGILISIVVIVGLFFNQEVLVQVLRLPDRYLTSDTYALYNFVLISNVFLFLAEIPMAVLDSLQKIYISNILQVVNIILSRGGVLFALSFGGKFAAIGLALFISAGIWFILILVFFFHFWKFTNYNNLFKNYFVIVKKHLQYGYKVYLTGVSTFFYEPFTKILIGRYIGVAEVGIFDIAFKLKNTMWSLLSKVMHPFTPLIASQTDIKIIGNIVDRISRKLLVISIPMIVIAASVVRPFIVLWLGKDTEPIIFASVTIISGYIILISSLPVYQYLLLKNHPEKNFYMQILNAGLSFIFFVLTVPLWGFSAAIYSFVGAVLCTNSLSIYYQNKYLNSNILMPVENILKSCLIGFSIYSINTVVKYFVLNNISFIIIVIAMDLIIILLMSIWLNLITRDDIRWVFGDSGRIPIILNVFRN